MNSIHFDLNNCPSNFEASIDRLRPTKIITLSHTSATLGIAVALRMVPRATCVADGAAAPQAPSRAAQPPGQQSSSAPLGTAPAGVP